MLNNRCRSKLENNSKMQSWCMELADFNSTVQYREAENHNIPDSFTRVNCVAAAANLEDVCVQLLSRRYSSSKLFQSQVSGTFHSRQAKCML